MTNLNDPALFINRELSWLRFNHRVLEEAQSEDNPLLERLKFLAIVSSNLDEFFMVRVAGVQQQRQARVDSTGPDGVPPGELFHRLHQRCHEMIREQYRVFRQEVMPALRAEGLRLLKPRELTREQQAAADAYFEREVFPVLSPLTPDPGRPVPHLHNLGMYLVVTMRGERDDVTAPPRIGLVQVPDVLDRFVKLPCADGTRDIALLEEVIGPRVDRLFLGFKVLSCSAFRITRNFDLNVDEDEAEDLLQAIEEELRERRRGEPVRLELQAGCDPTARRFLVRELDLLDEEVYTVRGPLNLKDFMGLAFAPGFEHLKDRPFVAPVVPALQEADKDMFAAIRRGDILLHHPFDSFSSVVDLVEQAANDPDVLAIKQTLYRTSGDSPIVKSLVHAAEQGKQVSVLVELKARFDEDRNIQWARQLEEAGAHVVYGLLGLKTHCKTLLIVRRDRDRIRRYLHLGTGNYHPATAKLYTDTGLFTCDDDLGQDVSQLFNILTGYSAFPKWRKLAVAPKDLKPRIIEMIEREAAQSTAEQPGRIIIKVNAVLEPEVIQAMYRASQAGVQIDLICRGICGLRPGVQGVSENIRVRSIVGRFLEHSRIYYFANGGNPELYMASADLMERNLNRRIETMFPIQDPRLRDHIVDQILPLYLNDNVKARELQPDGVWKRVEPAPGEERLNAQEELLRRAQDRAPLGGEAKVGPNAWLLLRRLAGQGTPAAAAD